MSHALAHIASLFWHLEAGSPLPWLHAAFSSAILSESFQFGHGSWSWYAGHTAPGRQTSERIHSSKCSLGVVVAHAPSNQARRTVALWAGVSFTTPD